LWKQICGIGTSSGIREPCGVATVFAGWRVALTSPPWVGMWGWPAAGGSPAGRAAPLVARLQVARLAGAADALGVGMAPTGGVSLRREQHVVAHRVEQLVAERAAIRRGPQALRAAEGPPADVGIRERPSTLRLRRPRPPVSARRGRARGRWGRVSPPATPLFRDRLGDPLERQRSTLRGSLHVDRGARLV